MAWAGWTDAATGQRAKIAGAAIVVVAVVGLLVWIVARPAVPLRDQLTVELPAAANDRIYASPVARGRPIVVIDAGHGGRDPGATSLSARK